MVLMKENDVIKVGVACLVLKDGRVLLGRRISKSHGDGEYTCGGGHAEFMEELAQAAKREIEEEWNISIDEPSFLCMTDLRKYGNKHYVDVAFKANWVNGEPSFEAEGEFADFGWYDVDNLPSPLFGAVANYFEAMKTGKCYFETQK